MREKLRAKKPIIEAPAESWTFSAHKKTPVACFRNQTLRVRIYPGFIPFVTEGGKR